MLRLESWRGPPNIKYKQYETVLFFKVSLFIPFIRTRRQRVGKKNKRILAKKQRMKMYPPKSTHCPFNVLSFLRPSIYFLDGQIGRKEVRMGATTDKKAEENKVRVVA